MSHLEQLYFLLGYLEGLSTKDSIMSSDLRIIMDAIETNPLFREVANSSSDTDDDYFDDEFDTSHRESFGQYRGSYAQDVEGLSDDFINDVLEGDPDNYWNID